MLLPDSENQYIEFKQSFNAATIETLVAFANSKGGTVYVGMEDNGDVKGVLLGKESIAQIVNEIKFKTIPSLIPDVEVIEFSGRTILLLSVQEYPVKPVSTQGRYYKRVGNSNHQLSIAEVVDMHLLSMNSSWDYYLDASHSVEDISLDKVMAAIEKMKLTGKMVDDDPLTFLMKYDLIRDGKLSNAAYLLFKKDNSVITTIELGYFQDEIVIKDSDRSKEDILTQVDRVMDFVRKHINKEVIITGKPQSIHRWQYPLEAIREIVMNMIIHRDYRSASDSIVKIYPDKIEFYNPGRLPDNITVEDLWANTYKSTPRNKLIADFCKDLGIVEKYGSGIRRILDYFRKEKQKEPVFGNISDGFMVTVFADKLEDVTLQAGGETLQAGGETLQAGGETLQAGEIVKKRMNKNDLMALIEYHSSDRYLTIDQLAALVNRNAAYLKNELIPVMLETGRLVRLYPDKPNHPNQAYKKCEVNMK
ncbi:RNA-binding domain-containing protein [uncultured Parabacteroides sp.]|uniref:RNA-binding domain-containing protein n=1 Tax=uncultured Parabacteroides sp. TaxID=512312 RepID=UPI0025EDE38F|nr:RNA-binding domain-containing protein [uncultured Parabacteroides sp.]